MTTSFGREVVVRERTFEGTRGGRGKVVLRRGTIESWARGPELWLLADDATPTNGVGSGEE